MGLWYKKIGRVNIIRHRFFYHYLVITFVVVGLGFLRNQTLYEQKAITTSQKTNTTNRINIPMKYILLWTNRNCYPFVYFGEGNKIFVEKSCKWTNCYVTANKNLLGAYTEFEVIAFNGPQLPPLLLSHIPRLRDAHQKYVFANIESAANYPIRTKHMDNFFNWTWTYKLDSDAAWGYITVKDANNNVIGPRKHMHWLDVDHMDPITDEFKIQLQDKRKAAAWFASNCVTKSRRENFVITIQHYLKQYNLNIDVFGRCGDHQCPKKIMGRCLKMIRKYYYFYLSFENSFSEDYVTEKLLYPLQNNAIPIVYGGANYSRFLPKGIYLDAVELGAEKLAHKMYEIIKDPKTYYKYFRWKKYYSFHTHNESPDTDDYCNFCAMLNNETKMKTHTSYDNFSAWWMNNVK